MKQAARRRPRTRDDADNAVGATIAPASSPYPLVFLPAGAASRPSAELPLGQVTTHSLGALRRSLQEPANWLAHRPDKARHVIGLKTCRNCS